MMERRWIVSEGRVMSVAALPLYPRPVRMSLSNSKVCKQILTFGKSEALKDSQTRAHHLRYIGRSLGQREARLGDP